MLTLSLYLSQERGNAAKLARAVEISHSFLVQIAQGERPCPPKVAVRIERETLGVVGRAMLLPDDWQEIWPELANQAPAAIETGAGEVAHG